MSLDVMLKVPYIIKNHICTCMECGNKHVIDEHESRYTVYEANITHNLNTMADAVGIYEALWRPDQYGFVTAGQLIPVLEAGLKLLQSDPEKYSKFDSPNGWGTYKHFVPFVEKYLQACKENSEAQVHVSR